MLVKQYSEIQRYSPMANIELLQYTRKEIDEVGKEIRGCDSITEGILASIFYPDSHRCRAVINNWRAVHNFPLELVTSQVREYAHSTNEKSLVVYKLKRLRSIVRKLRRFGNISLTEMRDIGGCRTVMDSVEEVNSLVSIIKPEIKGNIFLWEKDYILQPKGKDGYRSYHLTYSHYGTNPQYNELNNIRTEIQIRTRLQHYWATASTDSIH